MKRCSKCGETKPLAMFYLDPNPRNRTGRQSRCIACAKVASVAYGKAHPEWKAKQDRSYRKRYPEKQRQQYANKIAAKPEKYRALAKERSRRYRDLHPGAGLKGNAERLRRFRLRHPEKETAARAHRSADQLAPAWGNKPMIRVVYAKARHYGMEVDHIVPLKHPLVSGLHVWHNLQLLDRNLNRVKKNVAWPEMP